MRYPIGERQKFSADRYRRVWLVVEEIAARPGQSRADLAELFILSERQIQADVEIIRTEIGLPLVRERGYRFEGPPSGACTLPDALKLVAALRLGYAYGQMPRSALRDVATTLAALMPGHLAPLMAQFLADAERPGLSVLERLAAAIVDRKALRVDLRRPYASTWAEITPDVLVPICGEWWVIGHGKREADRPRDLMLRVAEITAIGPAVAAA